MSRREPETESSGGALRPEDLKVLAGQNSARRFDHSKVVSVARRCAHGYPQVLVCKPLAGGVPFPTVFWLTCPYIDRRCGELESQQKILELESIFRAEERAISALNNYYAELRKSLIGEAELQRLKENRPAIWESLTASGIGGIDVKKYPFAAKCLHLQVATWLGIGRHPAGKWLLQNIGELDCKEARCRKYAEQ